MRSFYLRNERKFPVALVITELHENSKGEKFVEFALSTHNPLDKFDKTLAKSVAEGRLYNGIGTKFTGLVKAEPKQIKLHIMEQIAKDKDVPTRTREAAKLWLKRKAA